MASLCERVAGRRPLAYLCVPFAVYYVENSRTYREYECMSTEPTRFIRH